MNSANNNQDKKHMILLSDDEVSSHQPVSPTVLPHSDNDMAYSQECIREFELDSDCEEISQSSPSQLACFSSHVDSLDLNRKPAASPSGEVSPLPHTLPEGYPYSSDEDVKTISPPPQLTRSRAITFPANYFDSSEDEKDEKDEKDQKDDTDSDIEDVFVTPPSRKRKRANNAPRAPNRIIARLVSPVPFHNTPPHQPVPIGNKKLKKLVVTWEYDIDGHMTGHSEKKFFH